MVSKSFCFILFQSVITKNLLNNNLNLYKLSECAQEIELDKDAMTCSASTEYGIQNVYPCINAINKDPSNSWVTNGEPVGAWIKISLDKTYRVTRMKLRHRAKGAATEKFKGIKIEFSDGAGVDHDLEDTMNMNEIALTSSHVTDFVKITSTSHIPHPWGNGHNGNNGFSDIRIFGCVEGRISII